MLEILLFCLIAPSLAAVKNFTVITVDNTVPTNASSAALLCQAHGMQLPLLEDIYIDHQWEAQDVFLRNGLFARVIPSMEDQKAVIMSLENGDVFLQHLACVENAIIYDNNSCTGISLLTTLITLSLVGSLYLAIRLCCCFCTSQNQEEQEEEEDSIFTRLRFW